MEKRKNKLVVKWQNQDGEERIGNVYWRNNNQNGEYQIPENQ